MAATSDSTVTGGRGRASNSGIVFAADRTASRRMAHRHSRNVRLLKVALPLLALSTLVVFVMTVLNDAGMGPSIANLQIPQIIAENLKMKNPHYEGFQSDGGHYWVKAETAQQDLKSLNLVHLDGITGDLIDVKKQKTHLVAARGLFDNKANILELYDSIHVTGDGGLNATLTHATVKTKEGLITSDQPSTILMGAGRITSNQLTIHQKTKQYTFVDDVKTHIKPKETASGPKDKTDGLPFGKPGEPVDVTSNRLDVDDNKNVALFTGNVIANQAGSTLQSPEMTVTYEGSVAPQSGSKKNAPQPATNDDGTKVKQIFARDSVTLTQPSGEKATSRTATFDSATQVAMLDGDVILTQGDDKKAVGDHAEYHEADQTMILTGPVVVTQGKNILKGRRLVYNRAMSKMHLTAPTDTSAGRITAHFVKPKQSTKPSDEDQAGSADGIPFGPAFKTDPNAPYDVTSDRLDVDDNAKTALFTGDVVTVQGKFTIRSAEMTAYYTGHAGLDGPDDKSKDTGASLTHIHAKKNVSIVSSDGQKATGDWAEVNVKTNLATLGGTVVLTQGKNVVRGTKLLIDMTTGQATIKTEPATTSSDGSMVSASGISSNGQMIKADRPTAVFYPNQLGKKAKEAAEKSGIDGWQVRSSP
ncbi:LPS export ABC transporter periplasmic protein LptC [Hyphomicrobium sp.]|jgi:lipopolysaccharide transport protein LptA/LPS export ABC transporter protein LptC|uniref:LPS export ABC transporter periplasmic protein LptC n=1 Tax=Hyphomicrobium sp. TaxID=82 RepID=UPI002C43D92E|nr:LPS export ABC transporter periplasmic protein LptC [Hyphomicrobium sp.]HVZ03309.1 LPS export ABC transporter periplasmic protein LptC [Hyphomicrobium sp.]